MTSLLLREGAEAAAASLQPSAEMAPAAPSAEPRVDLAVIDDLASFEALEADWNALFEAVAGPGQVFQAYGWCWQWCRHYLPAGLHPSRRLAVVTGRIDGRLVLVLPLVAERRAGLTELLWLGEPVSQYGDLLVTPEACHIGTLRAAWSLAVEATRADHANLRKVRADAAARPLLEALAAHVTCTEEAPYLDLTQDTSFAAWEARRQPRAAKNRKRQARRLADMGALAFASFTGSQDAARLARHAVALKRTSLGDKGAISPALACPRFEAFFADAAAGLGSDAGVNVKALTIEGEPAALKVVIERNRTSLLHIAVFDPRFEKCGAGAVLLEHVIGDAIARGQQRLDLLAPRHAYKMDFADGVVAVSDYALAVSLPGRLYVGGWLRVRRRVKALIEAAPAPLRRLVARLAG
jgi:CelD/BcsL family acetyltransferase involved in cellulose biosynthesis